MGFLDSVKNALRGAVAAPSPRPDRPAAEAPPAPAPEVPDEPREAAHEVYTVRTGDTLREIGARHGVTRDELARLNGIDEPELIFPGQQIRLPAR